ncbi:uncharacterized protein LOC126868985 isoform X6 [Bombus huntii]|uniref:uncharacterized protein LOC126868985 isoform X6 n=1 Tax=Bombus huntii TaxID=85661 RepID=UPI0021AAC20E|nr:uncharacterized protein LOC126868985 isoform X6 [Bombus huntii]
MMLYYIVLAIVCMRARRIFQHGRSRVSLILLFRCCITYLDRSRNIIRFFDMPWILTTAAFNRLISVVIKILLFRCCITYLDRSRNIIRFFDMPWILTTAAFNRLISVVIKILLFRCCITYLDRSRNIIRFFDMPWILTTAAFNRLISVVIKGSAICVVRRTVACFHNIVVTFSTVVTCIKAVEVNLFIYSSAGCCTWCSANREP